MCTAWQWNDSDCACHLSVSRRWVWHSQGDLPGVLRSGPGRPAPTPGNWRTPRARPTPHRAVSGWRSTLVFTLVISPNPWPSQGWHSAREVRRNPSTTAQTQHGKASTATDVNKLPAMRACLHVRRILRRRTLMPGGQCSVLRLDDARGRAGDPPALVIERCSLVSCHGHSSPPWSQLRADLGKLIHVCLFRDEWQAYVKTGECVKWNPPSFHY